jgi:formamidopyrimidine-DNA glycosylase
MQKLKYSFPDASGLGFDPILSMPYLADFSCRMLERACPIKALLLNQPYSSDIGNWVAGKGEVYAGDSMVFL